jgi:O-antigen ligase
MANRLLLADHLVPVAIAVLLFLGALVFTALTEHPILRVRSTPTSDFVRALAPVLVGLAVLAAAYRPWPGLVGILALTPVWNATQVEVDIGPIQIVLQTVFVVALAAGCVREYQSRRKIAAHGADYPGWYDQTSSGLRTLDAPRARLIRFDAARVAKLAVLGFVVFATASTLASPDLGNSANSLIHGILEPVAFGAILLWLKPSPRGLVLVACALAVSIALGSLIDVLQAVKAYPNLTQIVNHRLLFTEVTYDNVGLFGVILAAVLPMIAAVLLLRRDLAMPRWGTLLVSAAGILSFTGLFFTISKSAWVATAGALTLLLLLLMHTWWKRLATSLAVVALSAIFIPWPTVLLQSIPPVDSAYQSAVIAMVGKSRFDSWNPATLSGHGSMAERYYAIEGGLKMATDHPLLGVGLDEFHHYYIDLGYRPADALDNLDHAHSVFPEVAAELGLPALAMLLAVFGAAAWAMWKVYRGARDNVSRTLAAMLIVSIAGWIVAATAYGADIYRPFRDQSSDIVAIAVIVAMALALSRWSRETRGV